MRKLNRLRPLSEAECYHRCHGRRETDVRIVHLEPRRPRYDLKVSGEDLRRSFEAKLDEREQLPAADADGLAELPPLEHEPAAAAGGR